MTAAMLLFFACHSDIAIVKHRYVRPQGDGFALEAEVMVTPAWRRFVTCQTARGNETMSLTYRYTTAGKLEQAVVTLQRDGKTEKATAVFEGGVAKITRPDGMEEVKVGPNVIVTSEPDWNDVLHLVRRYDKTKGGKQEFAGLSIHPSKKSQTQRLTIEKTGADMVKIDGIDHTFTTYEARLRGSVNKVWTHADGAVVKILPAGEKQTPILLEGYAAALSRLK